MKLFGVVLLLLAFTAFKLSDYRDREFDRVANPLPAGNVQVLPPADTHALVRDTTALLSAPLDRREVGSAGSKAARAYLTERFAQIGLEHFGGSYSMPFTFTFNDPAGLVVPGKYYKTTYPDAANVVGFIRGARQPDRYIVITARLDTRDEQGFLAAPKWESNATGLASMLAIARHFKDNPPARTIVFAALDAGAYGHAGARAFLRDGPPQRMIALNLNLDMVSSYRPHWFFIAGTHDDPELAERVRLAAEWSPGFPIRLGHDVPKWRGSGIADWTHVSDHAVFHEAGIPFLFASIESLGEAQPDAPWTGDKTANALIALAWHLDRR